jgi:ABC-type bacteriocin/lantibiotic exporter with double-glycine peptidase domain
VLSALPQLAAAAASYGRIEELLDASDTPPYSGTQRIVPTGQLELRHVSFSYDDTVVLSDVSLTIAAGEHLALLGPNGSGKSTLAKLVLGLYRPREGQLLLDGFLYDDVELEDLHQASGVVLQDPVVLPGSIWDAITYGRPDLTEVEVHWAAGLVDLHAFVMTLDDGYQTAVGDEGARLSGGQRQRLALARALVGRPRLLVLDEPTNHLDDDAVRLLLRVLGSLEPAPTILSITHDVAFAAAADRVLHLRDGRLTEHTATPVLHEGSR